MCTFASKALRANAAGAAAAVIVQTHDVWPYVMEDSKGEVKAGGGLQIPVCMINKEKGERKQRSQERCGAVGSCRMRLRGIARERYAPKDYRRMFTDSGALVLNGYDHELLLTASHFLRLLRWSP